MPAGTVRLAGDAAKAADASTAHRHLLPSLISPLPSLLSFSAASKEKRSAWLSLRARRCRRRRRRRSPTTARASLPTRSCPTRTGRRPARPSIRSPASSSARSATPSSASDASRPRSPAITARTASLRSRTLASEPSSTGACAPLATDLAFRAAPDLTAPYRRLRCARNCFNCPLCVNTLTVHASEPPPDDGSGPAPPEASYHLACNFCRWSSAETGLVFEKPTGIARASFGSRYGVAPRR
jgi:hypothetical protein